VEYNDCCVFFISPPPLTAHVFCLCSFCSGTATYRYCRCIDCLLLNTVVLSVDVPLSERYVTLKAVVLSMTWKQKEFITLQIQIMKHHMKALLSPEHSLLSIITISHEVLCVVCLLHISAVTVPLNSRGRKLFLSLSKCLYTYFTIQKHSIKKQQLHIRFGRQTEPYSVSTILLLHIKSIIMTCLQNYNQMICNTMPLAMTAISGFKAPAYGYV